MSCDLVCSTTSDKEICSICLRRDVEEIGRALHLHRSKENSLASVECRHRTALERSKSNVSIRDALHKEKKASKWNWKPLKSLIHFGSHRLNCHFFLHIHAIEGLPPELENLSFCVTWKRKADISRTQPAKVSSGMAEFEETLVHQCRVRCAAVGPHRSLRYESKQFLLRPVIIEAPSLDIGKHWIDLSRLLPLTLDELDEEGSSSGKWTTNFRLSGKAKAAFLNVTFGFSVSEHGHFVKVPQITAEDGLKNHETTSKKLHKLGSSSKFSNGGSFHASLSLKPELHDGIVPKKDSDLSNSVALLYKKLDEGMKRSHTESDLFFEKFGLFKPPFFNPSDDELFGLDKKDSEFDVDELPVENSNSSTVESSHIESIDVAEISFDEDVESNSVPDTKADDDIIDESNTDELLETMSSDQSDSFATLLHDFSDIENDFLSMLSITETPREDKFVDSIIDLSFSLQQPNTKKEIPSSLRSRRNAELLENLETEALMHQWGLNEEAFQYETSGGFGSPVYTTPDEEPPLNPPLPCIEDGIGPVIRTKDGGFLSSLNPLLFKNANNNARLIVQISPPLLLPVEITCNLVDVLRCWASVGIDSMSTKLNESMPLEDITGKTMLQVMLEGQSSSSSRGKMQLEDVLVIPSIAHIGGLLLEALKIQSGMADHEAPARMLPISEGFPCFFDRTDREFLSADSVKMCFNLQLRDPIRNYEAVGSPMIAVVRADRAETAPPSFEVSDAVIAGLSNVSRGKQQQQHQRRHRRWGSSSSREQEMGTRWLLSSGMVDDAEKKKFFGRCVSKTKAVGEEAAADVLWSISAPRNGGAVHIRNPDIVLPMPAGQP